MVYTVNYTILHGSRTAAAVELSFVRKMKKIWLKCKSDQWRHGNLQFLLALLLLSDPDPKQQFECSLSIKWPSVVRQKVHISNTLGYFLVMLYKKHQRSHTWRLEWMGGWQNTCLRNGRHVFVSSACA